jgi:hypothetical protein
MIIEKFREMNQLGKLRRNFERFCYKHRDKGIPNLMLYITIGAAIVYILSLVNGGTVLYQYLRFDKTAILKGQVWRLFTYVFTYSPGMGPVLVLVGLYFFYHLSRHVEAVLGTLKFNIFYFSGMVLMDVFAMIFCPTDVTLVSGIPVGASTFTALYSDMAWYLHLSIILLFCATNPEAEFLVFFIIPVKAWFIALLDLVLIAISMFNMFYPVNFFPHNLFPLVGLLNFLLFAGKDVLNLFPFLQGIHIRKPKPKPKTGAVPFPSNNADRGPKPKDFTHRCAICGRTDTSHPELEFRYCSRCKGYFCYCQDHINNHTHIEE